MDKFSKSTFVSLIVGLLLCVFSASSPGEEGRIELKFDDRFVSANIENVPLRIILDKIKREKGLWYKLDGSLSENRVSVHFVGLPLPDALKRILSRIDYSLMFNSNDDLVGVFIFGKGAKDGYQQKDSRPPVTVTTERKMVRGERKGSRPTTSGKIRKKAVKEELSPEEADEDKEEDKEDKEDKGDEDIHKE
jgi:hypothetical protein